MATLFQDIRHALRLFARSPGFAAAAIVVVALGIGANTAIFSIVHAVLLEPLPFPEPERLVRVWHIPPPQAFPGLKRFSVSAGNYVEWEKQNHVFEKMAIVGYARFNVSGTGEPESIQGSRVSKDFFAVLGTRPLLGRTFLPQEDEPGAGHVVVLSQSLWQNRFGGDKGIVGRDIPFDGVPYRVIGVMGKDAIYPDTARFWVPTAWTEKDRSVRNNHNYSTVARLKKGVSLEQANAEMRVISDRLARQYPEDDKDWGATVVPLKEDRVGDVRPLLLVLLGAVAFVLLIACANVANLMLARTVARQKEIAVRSALGASRTRLLRQLISESILLTLIGGGLGLFLATFGMKAMVKLLADEIPRSTVVGLNPAVLLFTLAVSILTGALAGLAPAWRGTRTNLADSLKQGLGRTAADSSGHRTRSVLVVSEVALSLVLLIGAGLLIRTLWNLRRVDPGFDPRNLWTMSVVLPRSQWEDKLRQVQFFQRALERMRAVPGVQAAAAVSNVPLTGESDWPIQVEGRTPLPVSQQPNVVSVNVAGDYLKAMRIPLLRGRWFAATDEADAPGVLVISESMARRFWPGEDPMGKRLTIAFAPEKVREVVGIVGDVKSRGLEQREPVPEMYVPHSQIPSPAMDFVVRGGPSVARAAVAAIHEVDPGMPVIDVNPMEEVLASSLSRQRFGMILFGSFAALALVLAAVGIYSVLSYTVRHRRREIGIRMALGAQLSDVVGLVVLQGMRPAALGIGIGLAAAVALGRLLTSVVYGVSPSDPWTLGSVGVLLALVALFACILPAFRAARVDPLQALREE
jgi:putative ABC transport system permease protein